MTHSKLAAILLVVAVVIVGGYMISSSKESNTSEQSNNSARADYRQIPYQIEEQSVTLKTGEYFGNEATGDLNGDGQADIAFLITQRGGGSGTFFYAVVALQTEHGFTGTNAILLGDRIAPQTTEIRDGQVIINYADRKAGEPMTANPSVGVSKYLKVANGVLTVIK